MGALIGEMDLEEARPLLAASSGVGPAEQPYAAPAVQHGHVHPPPGRIGQLVTGANVGPTGGVFEDTSLKSSQATRVEPGAEVGAAGRESAGLLSPVVVRLAAHHGINLDRITGTGSGGRITKKDVLEAAARRDSEPEARSEETSGDRVVEPTAIRKIIAAHMARSFREIPHAWSAIEVDVSGMTACRAAHRGAFHAAHGIDLTYLAFSVHAVAASLRANPMLNSSWEDGRIRLFGEVNIGIAVAAPSGLVVPVLRAAGQGSVSDLALRLAPLVERARLGRLSLDDVRGGTFTLNNTGALGSVWGGAIINHPQSAILTTEAITRRPVAVQGETGETVEVRPVMNLCISFDHRVADGAEAAAFLQDVKKRLTAFTVESAIS